jgi:protein-disulfide isomerase
MKANKSALRTGLEILSNVLVIAAALSLLWVVLRNPMGAPATPTDRSRVSAVDGLSIQVDALRHVKGAGDVVLLEFADYECPFCGHYARDVIPRIEAEFVESARVMYAFMHFPIEAIHPLALKAGEAAECAGRQGQFWQMHRRLFADVSAIVSAELPRHAAELELDEATFTECLASGATSSAIRRDRSEGERLGITGTPTTFIGERHPDGLIRLTRRFQGSVPYELVQAEILDALERK